MPEPSRQSFIAVDVGNTRTKLGRFALPLGGAVPEPLDTLEICSRDWTPRQIADWLSDCDSCVWRIASVFSACSNELAAWVEGNRRADSLTMLSAASLPLVVRLAEPARVGLDRLLGAVAANALREAARGAVVVDLGTAISVDLVSTAGEFLGGAILPGIGMSANALHEKTALLPSVPMSELHDPPPALGTSTIAAIHSGLYWGAVGSVRELVARLSASLPGPPHVLLTGGAAPTVAKLLGSDAVYLPHLVLSGIALAYQHELRT